MSNLTEALRDLRDEVNSGTGFEDALVLTAQDYELNPELLRRFAGSMIMKALPTEQEESVARKARISAYNKEVHKENELFIQGLTEFFRMKSKTASMVNSCLEKI